MIKYYVSSTFCDMQAERDALQNLVLPEIEQYANARGIDHCHSYMIILLGDRYDDSIPNVDALDSCFNSSQEQFLSVADQGKSITEMEIIHGLFHRPNSGDFIICIREPLPKEKIKKEMIPIYFETDSLYIEKLDRLKRELIEKYPQNILRYSAKWDEKTHSVVGLEEFINKLTLRLRSQIDNKAFTLRTPEKAQQNADELSVVTKAKTFVGREAQLLDIDEFMNSSEHSELVVESGVGKSSRPVIGEEEEKHLQKVFCMASEIRHESDTAQNKKVLYISGIKLLLRYTDIINQASAHDNSDAVNSMCIEALNKLIPILDILINGDDREKNYDAVTILLKNSMNNIDTQHRLAVQALNEHKYSLAYIKSLFAFKLLLVMKGHLDIKKWLSLMLDASNLLSVCSHNVGIEAYNSNIDESAKIEYLITEMSANVKMFSSILSYEMLFQQDDFLKKYKSIFRECLGSYICALYGLLEFTAENIADPPKEKLFWEFINRINYQIPNTRTVYFDILRDDRMKKMSSEYILSIGKYLYEHFQEERVQKLLYFSLLFEDITLEYAYQVMDFSTAKQIIENGYDRYLELSTLYIIRKHDRKEFYNRVNELKFVCLKKHRKLIRQYDRLYQITGRLFITEADNLFKAILFESQSADINDPRMHSTRSVFKFIR